MTSLRNANCKTPWSRMSSQRSRSEMRSHSWMLTVAVSGCSYGGIQTLLVGERDVKALVPFAPGETHQDGHWKFCSTATGIWGSDVLAFLEEKMSAH